MIAIGRYFVFSISLAGMTLSVEGRINDDDAYKMLDKIFELHNKYRQKHGVSDLTRTDEMDLVAGRIIDNLFLEQNNDNFSEYGKNICQMEYNEDTELNNNEAKKIFSKWYENGIDYNYFHELYNNSSHNAFTQIIWNNTDTIGLAFRATYDTYLVQVVYLPRGNIPGEYEMNVFQRPIIAFINNAPLNQFIYDNDKSIFEDYILNLHNLFRIKHKAQIMRRDEELDNYAKNTLHLISNNLYEYQRNQGMNYYEKEYDNFTVLDKAEAETIFLEWYSKGTNYNYDDEPLNNDAAEFTQIVWNNTTSTGISLARDEGFYRVLVLYNPPGNIENQFKFNVFKNENIESNESSSNTND